MQVECKTLRIHTYTCNVQFLCSHTIHPHSHASIGGPDYRDKPFTQKVQEVVAVMGGAKYRANDTPSVDRGYVKTKA